MSVLDYFVFVAIIAIWGILVVNLILTMAGYLQYLKIVRTPVYHRRYRVSLLSSAWDQVVPRRYGRQANSSIQKADVSNDVALGLSLSLNL